MAYLKEVHHRVKNKPYANIKKSASQLKSIDHSKNIILSKKKFFGLMNFSLDQELDSIETDIDRISMIKDMGNKQYKYGKKNQSSQSVLGGQQRESMKNLHTLGSAVESSGLDLDALNAFSTNKVSLRRDRHIAV